jgi:hypothetical protein
MTFTDEELAVLASGQQSIAIFFRMETNPIIRLWLGFGNIYASGDVVDPGGATYNGFGEIVGLPDFNQLINGAAERVEFTMSGVDGPIATIAANEANDVKGKIVLVGLGVFDTNWQLLGAPHWFSRYTADFLQIDRHLTTDGKHVATITLSCSTRFTGRRRPSFGYFSHQDQQARYPGDLFCQYVTNYALGFQKEWPVF